MMSSNSILYYPTIEFRDENWLKAALLIWDNIYRIVPYAYSPNDSDDIKFAVDQGRIKSIILEEQDLSKTYDKYNDFISNLTIIPDGLENSDGTTRIHRDKIDTRLYPILEAQAKKFDNEWIEMSSAAARGYMMYLSQVVSENRHFARATDNVDSWIMSVYMNENGNFSEFVYDNNADGQYASIELLDLIPVQDITKMSIRNIVDKTNTLVDERNEFRSVVNNFLNELAPCSSADGTYEIIEKYKNELKRVKDQFKKSTSFSGNEFMRSSLAVGIPTALTTFGALMSTQPPIDMSIFLESIAVGWVASMADYSRVKTTNRGTKLGTYLMNLEMGERLNYNYNYIMDQFIND